MQRSIRRMNDSCQMPVNGTRREWWRHKGGPRPDVAMAAGRQGMRAINGSSVWIYQVFCKPFVPPGADALSAWSGYDALQEPFDSLVLQCSISCRSRRS